MKFFLDTGNVEEVRRAAALGVLDGVTTNPTLLAKEGKPFREALLEMCALVEIVNGEVVATDAEGRTVGGGDVVAQARQVHENLERCLAAAGATFADVCKVTVFLRNAADRERVNTVRKEYFGAHRPASTLVEISRLVREDLLIEIEAIAVLPERGAARGKPAARQRARRGRR